MDHVYRKAAKIWEERKMTLSEKRCLFTSMLAMLIRHANALGYGVNIDCVKCYLPGHHRKGSVHYDGLAADLNLFKGGKLLQDDESYGVLHDYFDSIGGAARIPGDLRHFSVEHNGVR